MSVKTMLRPESLGEAVYARRRLRDRDEFKQQRQRERKLPRELLALRDRYVAEMQAPVQTGAGHIAAAHHRDVIAATAKGDEAERAEREFGREAVKQLLCRPWGSWVFLHLTGGIDLLDLASIMGIGLTDAEMFVRREKSGMRAWASRQAAKLHPPVPDPRRSVRVSAMPAVGPIRVSPPGGSGR